jgi:hypothetical protein
MNQMEAGEPIKFNTEREKSENEVLLAEVLPVFSELEYSYHLGGDSDEVEGENGDWEFVSTPGKPDFEEAKEKLGKILSTAPSGLKEKTLGMIASLSEKCTSAKENEWFDFNASLNELEDAYLNDLGNKEQIAAKEELLKSQQENLSVALDKFIEDSILRFPPGSSERRVWGNALKDYREGNPESLINILEGEVKKSDDQQAKEWLRFLKFNKKEKVSGDVVVYPPTGSFS